jgi:hypothetical protein
MVAAGRVIVGAGLATAGVVVSCEAGWLSWVVDRGSSRKWDAELGGQCKRTKKGDSRKFASGPTTLRVARAGQPGAPRAARPSNPCAVRTAAEQFVGPPLQGQATSATAPPQQLQRLRTPRQTTANNTTPDNPIPGRHCAQPERNDCAHGYPDRTGEQTTANMSPGMSLYSVNAICMCARNHHSLPLAPPARAMRQS